MDFLCPAGIVSSKNYCAKARQPQKDMLVGLKEFRNAHELNFIKL